MNWKTEAKEKLRRYSAMKNALVTIPQEIERLEVEGQSIRSSRTDGTPVRGGGSGREEAMLNNIVHRQELTWALQQAQMWKQVTDQALSVLNESDQLILRLLYIYPEKGSLSRLCKELGCGKSSIYRRRDEAMYKFTIALYGAIET